MAAKSYGQRSYRPWAEINFCYYLIITTGGPWLFRREGEREILISGLCFQKVAFEESKIMQSKATLPEKNPISSALHQSTESYFTWEHDAMVLTANPTLGAQATSLTQSLWASSFSSSTHWPSTSLNEKQNKCNREKNRWRKKKR